MSNRREQSSKQRPTRFPWPPVLIAGAILAALVLQRVMPLAWPGTNDLPARVVGYGIGIAGCILFTWAAATLLRAGTTVLPNAGASQLVTTGPFRFRRNPIYLSEILMLLGLAEVTKNVWFVIAAPVFAGLVTWLAIVPEEAHLEERFGDAYREYKSRVRRLI